MMLYVTNRLVFLLVCSFALVELCSCQNEPGRDLGKQKLALADSLFKNGNADSALLLLDQIEKEYPKIYGLNIKRAEIYVARRDSARAGEYLAKEISLFPDSADAYFHQGMFYFLRDHHTEAIASFQQGLELRQDWKIYSALAQCYDFEKKYEEAIFSFSQAIRLNTADYQLYALRSTAFSRVGKDSMALADMLKSEALGNDNVFVSYYLGNCYEAVQDYRNAAINFKQFLFLRGGDTTGPFAFGLIDRSIANGLADEVYGLRLAIYEREVQRSDYFSDAKKTFQKNYNDPQVSIVFPILLNPETIQLQSPSVKFSERDSISLTIDRYTLEITSTE